jgi:hypothetical protein
MERPKSWDALRNSPSNSGGTAKGYVSVFMDESYIILSPRQPGASIVAMPSSPEPDFIATTPAAG